ncbi:glycosyltransferase family 2 protein [Flavobacterium ajazii]|uniref:glycosyltransferase family 2 protein n=1 Tax=Flavobacterium ajazii TaxID=2692318 RepID=UPI0013D74B3A|nr:glycosyltransferase family 2 protein [Flavobacterium ajazii]
MLSILIPTYNYNVYNLVLELHKQCTESGIEFEIVCLDDASVYYSAENQKIKELANCHYLVNDINSGRTFTRNKLAEKALYKWLLFLDADVIPVNSNFINNYISFLNNKFQVVVGGYSYQEIKSEPEIIFRHKYGKDREEKVASKRNLTPYNYIFSGNILIWKETFKLTNYASENAFYGMDNFFAYQLFLNKIKVIHIENPIYHLGLETNQIFFEKSLKSVEMRKEFLIDCDQIEKINPLIKNYKKIKRYHLLPIAIFFFKISEPFLKRRILNKNPNLFCFDIYRLGYICTLK